jgi:hypothetical protein
MVSILCRDGTNIFEIEFTSTHIISWEDIKEIYHKL